METYLDLSKGLHTDFEPINAPEGTYRYMLNSIRQLSGAIENELGTSIITSLDNNARVVGKYILDSDIILCITNDLNHSQIGILDSNDVYTIKLSRSELNFKLGSIIKIEGKKNYKGDRLLYLVEKNGDNPMRCINIDDPTIQTSISFIEDIALQINPIIPSIEVNSVVDGGTLPTGVYLATCRLLTKNTNTTSFGSFSSQVPIIDEALSASIDQQDGAPPQSNSPKSINFTISNIDTSFEYIEVAIATYIGTANVLSINSVGKLPIDGRDTISFTYSSVDQNKESIDLDAITIKPVFYTNASTIAQKDGILTIGNLSTSKLVYNFQQDANKVKLRYFIDEIPVIPGYKDAITAATKKGYQRDEVYSFAITPELDKDANTTSYHIPNSSQSQTANTDTKELGAYTSLETYPANRGYPVGNVVHFRMPTINQEPIIIVRNNTTYLRILGVEAYFDDFLSSIPDSIKSKITKLSIVRQIRSDNNKSVIAQGIANPHIKQNDVVNVFLSAFPNGAYGNTGFFSSSEVIGSEIGFMSPETTIYQTLPLGSLKLRTVSKISGSQTIINDERTHNADEIANTGMFLDYTDTSYNLINDIDILTNSAQYINACSADTSNISTNVIIAGTGDTVNNYKNNGYLFLKLSGYLPIDQTLQNGKPEFYYSYNGSDKTDTIYLNGIERSDNTTIRKGTVSRNLYNIVRVLDRQYGTVYDATYILCGSTTDYTNSLKVYGGDVFIGKFAVVNAMAFVGGPDEVQFKALSYFYCESSINVGYRHYNQPIGSEGQTNFIAGTTPYYPKLSILYNDPKNAGLTPGILNLSWALGHARGYNKQYSFESSLIKYYPKQLEEDVVTSFTNRVIYSLPSVEGEQFDSYRLFLPNNYHDIPKDKGPITELFVHNHKYYIHTSRSLYLSAFNDRVSQTSSIGEVYLGNGGVFSRPSEPILTIDGGYAGTTSSCGLNTPYGRIFLDNIGNKVYILSDSLDEISQKGMFKYFSKEIEDIEDKPSLDVGYTTAFDQQNHRILLTKIGQWTISYSPQLNSWSSFHSYIPYGYITTNQKLYSLNYSSIYRNNIGSYGVYYGNLPAPLQLDIVINDSPNLTKTFDNLTFFTTSKNSEGIEQHYDTFSTLQCYNTTRNNGKCRLIVPRNYQEDFQSLGLFECFAKLKSNEFRVAIPNDLIIDTSQSIFALDNLANSRAYRPSMSGKWLISSLVYNNLRNNKFVIHNIGRIFKQRIR